MSGCGGAALRRADTQGSAALRPAARLLGRVYLCARVCKARTWYQGRFLFRVGACLPSTCKARGVGCRVRRATAGRRCALRVGYSLAWSVLQCSLLGL